MGRHRGSGSYGHKVRCTSEAHGEYRISWTVDFYYRDSRCRFPRAFRRDTDRAGALRFCEKWRIDPKKVPGLVPDSKPA